MSDYKMDIRGEIGLSEYSNIHDYLGVVDKNDSFTITLNSSNEHEISIIDSMLKDNNFNIIKKGYDNFGIYYITAYKTK
ncbi:hypothetical protein NNC19_21040 [Clostridium sp. SHJSY1]|uniref:hypothetical protein n=1 Tax=Clostridium sp. SHJSY1 TaxID=2942483 RepID=UPI0028750861|nr:hypothetical protein [Clostridium sp. SHJSY1]MDS0528178.1 hypothetical protein [Clostridium sp. SHJSY1]